MLKRLYQQITEILQRAINWIKNNPLGFLFVMSLSLLLSWITWETNKLNNLGFSTKTFWDWMELLIIPFVLAMGALFFNRAERKAEQRIAAERFQEEMLRAYIDKMTELLLERELLQSSYGIEVRIAARAQSLTLFRILDGKRKGVILNFLADAELIKKEDPIISLEESDLSESDLNGARLYETNLSSTNLQGANLSNTLLCKSSLITANLRKANLKKADLRGVNFSGADLSGADLQEALLEGADFLDADLTGANLRTAVVLDQSQLHRAASLKNTTMPNGETYH